MKKKIIKKMGMLILWLFYTSLYFSVLDKNPTYIEDVFSNTNLADVQIACYFITEGMCISFITYVCALISVEVISFSLRDLEFIKKDKPEIWTVDGLENFFVPPKKIRKPYHDPELDKAIEVMENGVVKAEKALKEAREEKNEKIYN